MVKEFVSLRDPGANMGRQREGLHLFIGVVQLWPDTSSATNPPPSPIYPDLGSALVAQGTGFPKQKLEGESTIYLLQYRKHRNRRLNSIETSCWNQVVMKLCDASQ